MSLSPPTSRSGSGSAGAVSLLASHVLGADAALLDTSPADLTGYSHLRIVAMLRGTTAAEAQQVRLRFNADAGAHYSAFDVREFAGGPAAAEGIGATSMLLGFMPGASAEAGDVATIEAFVAAADGATFIKTVRGASAYVDDAASGGQKVDDLAALWSELAAITRVQLLPAADSFLAGSGLWVYGYE